MTDEAGTIVDVNALDADNPEDDAKLDALLDQLTRESEPTDEPVTEPAAAEEPKIPEGTQQANAELPNTADSTTGTPDAAAQPEVDWKKQAELNEARYNTLKGRLEQRETELEKARREREERDAEYQKVMRFVNDPRAARLLLELESGNAGQPASTPTEFDYTNPAEYDRRAEAVFRRLEAERIARDNAFRAEQNRATFIGRINANKQRLAVENNVSLEEIEIAQKEFEQQFDEGRIPEMALKLRTIPQLIADAEKRGAEAERKKFTEASQAPKRLAGVSGGTAPMLAPKTYHEMTDAELGNAAKDPNLTPQQEDEILKELLQRGT